MCTNNDTLCEYEYIVIPSVLASYTLTYKVVEFPGMNSHVLLNVSEFNAMLIMMDLSNPKHEKYRLSCPSQSPSFTLVPAAVTLVVLLH